MKIHLITFASENFSISANLCVRTARFHGVTSAAICKPKEEITPRGYGFWRWKPAIIRALLFNCEAFTLLENDDILIYADAGIEFVNNVHYIIERMDQDIFLFGNMWEHAHWCKRDVIDEIWPLESKLYTPPGCGWQAFGKQVQASVIFFRVSDFTRTFVDEWLKWSLFEDGRLIDDSPSRMPNHPEFQEHRHDQAILTTLAYREGLKLHWWPAEYNDGAFAYEKGIFTDNYPVIFHHHRKRNNDWTV